jgi:tRNA pseudouridine65 synthase
MCNPPPTSASNPQPPSAKEQLPIIYQDEHMVVVNKPSGLLVHRSEIDRHETRFALQIVRDQIGQHVFPVHRLDKPTSGVLLFALNKTVARALSEQFSAGTIEKHYLAITRGYAPQFADVDYPLKEEQDKYTDRKARKDKPAQEAKTQFERLAIIELPVEIEGYPQSRYSLVACKPATGRKHQIRRHLKHIGHPIIGDAKHGRGRHNRYFKEHLDAGRLLLHADSLVIEHPIDQHSMKLIAPLDSIFQNLAKRFQWQHALPDYLLSGTPNHEEVEADTTISASDESMSTPLTDRTARQST